MLRLTGYLPSDHIESQISEDHAPSDSNLANQKATFLWNNTQYYRNKIHVVDTSYHKETLYCEQSIVIKQANLDIERVRDNYYCAKTSQTSSFSANAADNVNVNDNNEHVPASMQSLGKAKLQCEDGKKEVLFNAVYDLEYQKEFIIAQPLHRKECTIANTFHETDGIMGSIPITLSTHKKQQHQQPQPQCKPQRVRPQPTTTNTKQNSQNTKENKRSNGLFSQISSFVASKLVKKINTGAANPNAHYKADHQSDNKYVRGYKVEMERCVLHDRKKVTSDLEKPKLENTYKSNNYKSGNNVVDVHQYLASEV